MTYRSTVDTSRPSGRLIVGLCAAAFFSGIALQALVIDSGGGLAVDSRRGERPTADLGESAPKSAEPGERTLSISGSTTTEQGVPAGFARTQEGAVAAAAAFVCTGRALFEMDPLAAEKAVRQMSATETADEQVTSVLDQLGQARQALAGGSGPVTFRQAAVAWRIDSFSTDEARVAVWHVGVLSREGAAPPQAGWATSTFDLVWEHGDWKVEHENMVPGPAPILNDSAPPATAALFTGALDGFTDFGGSR